MISLDLHLRSLLSHRGWLEKQATCGKEQSLLGLRQVGAASQIDLGTVERRTLW